MEVVRGVDGVGGAEEVGRSWGFFHVSDAVDDTELGHDGLQGERVVDVAVLEHFANSRDGNAEFASVVVSGGVRDVGEEDEDDRCIGESVAVVRHLGGH